MDWLKVISQLADVASAINWELGDIQTPQIATPLNQWIRPKPMRIKRPRTVRSFGSLLASLGLGNHIDPATSQDVIADIFAVTITGVTEDGQQKQWTAILDQAWENPWTDNPNDDYEGPWEDTRPSGPRRRRRR